MSGNTELSSTDLFMKIGSFVGHSGDGCTCNGLSLPSVRRSSGKEKLTLGPGSAPPWLWARHVNAQPSFPAPLSAGSDTYLGPLGSLEELSIKQEDAGLCGRPCLC